jgi:hypothetical protein
MAEQSIGYATTGTGDGPAAGYDSSRMTVIEAKTLGIGVLLQGSYLTASGTGTATLSIADGSAVVATGTTTVTGGYLYENTSTASIAVGAVANGTYNLVILANESGASVTVTRSVAGTTILTKTTRLALATSAQLSTAAQPYITLGTVSVASGLVSAISSYYAYATTRQLPPAIYATMSGGTVSLTAANTDYQIANFTSSTSSADGSISMDTASGTITILASGYYIFSVQVQYSAGTTGNRRVTMDNIIIYPPQSAALFATGATFANTYSVYVAVTPGSSVATNVKAWSSVTGQSVSNCIVNVKRI